MTAVIASFAQVTMVVLGAPLLVGVMRQVRARMEGRVGAGVWQPWRDLRKLFRRQPITPVGTTWAFRTAPLVLVGTTLVVAATIPLLTTDDRAGPGRGPVRSGGAAQCGHGGAGVGGVGHRHRVRWHGRQPGDDRAGAGGADHPGRGVRAVGPGGLHQPRAAGRRHPAQPAPGDVPGQPAGRRRAAGGDDRGDRSAAGGQPVHPPGAHHAPRGDGAGVLRCGPGR